MSKEMPTAKLLFYKDDNFRKASLAVFDFPTLIGKMKQKNAWLKGDLDTMILLKTPAKQIVLAALHEGTRITSFQSGESITFQIIEGKMSFNLRGKSVNLDKGQLLTLEEHHKYSMSTDRKTVLLLTITTNSVKLSEN